MSVKFILNLERGQIMNGIIIVNKSKGYTSHDIVAKVKKITGEKVGHTGTLDPLATGVLPILIGKGTLCSKYLMNHDKTYKVLLKLGIKKSTGDEEGEIIQEETVDEEILDERNVKIVLNSFLGEQMQIPPIYSAIKVKGKKLYEYARKGQKVEIEPRKITIYDIKLLKINKVSSEIQFEVSCSKGTYIRSLCEDIAQKIGTVGYMKELQRTRVGIFTIEQSVLAEDLTKETIEKYMMTIEKLFKDLENIELNEKKLQLFLNGVKLRFDLEEGIYKIYSNQQFIGIGVLKNNLLKRDIIMNEK